ncbi:hypothetical protein [Paenibacillus alba]|uniref:Large polyvalent protein associated domain-containing protein n=1 Tax=Paenibacillus alba TaxID=1197127 RepID=A0ABU6GAF7_9BACL|nr:hypothetical protein [Paenibacillus alba]MEC0231188.1 hypothetical protein [Paenibacillus alba]
MAIDTSKYLSGGSSGSSPTPSTSKKSNIDTGSYLSNSGPSAESINSRGSAESDESRLVSQSREISSPAKSKFSIPALDYVNEKVSNIGNLLNRAAISGADAIGLNQVKNRLGDGPSFVSDIFKDNAAPAVTTAEKAADIIGNLYGFTAPAMGAYATGGKLVGGALAKFAPNAPKLLQAIGRGAGAGLAYGAANEGLDAAVGSEDKSLGDRLKSVGTDAALFAAGDGALSALGSGIKAIASKYAGTKIGDALGRLTGQGVRSAETAPQDVLALPQGRGEARLNAAMERSNLRPNEDPILASGRVRNPEPLGLPEPNIAAPTKARLETRPNEYTSKFENLVNTANKMKFTPGRELEELESLWSQMAGPKDPALNELIDLAYPKQVSKVSADSLSKAKALQRSREVAGVPNKVRSMDDRYQPVVNEAVAPRQRVGFAEAPSAQAEIIPPQRRFAPTESTLTQQQPTIRNQQQVSDVVPALRSSEENLAARERGFAETVRASNKTPSNFKEKLKAMYTPITEEQTLAKANLRLSNDIEEAASFVMGKERFSAEKAATAQRLIDHFNSQGNYQRAVDIAEKVAEEATNSGQAIQALSLFNRLTPDGVLYRAQRIAKNINTSSPVWAKKVEVTEAMGKNIKELSDVTQRMTGVKDISNDVMNILERAKAGEKLGESDSATLKRFVTESKQFIQETSKPPKAPKPPQQIKDARVRDNVLSFLEQKEKEALERRAGRRNRFNSTPLDEWADMAIIGAAKLARGTVKFADWSEQMIRDLGEEVRPHLGNLYERAREAFEQSSKKVTAQTIDRAEKLTEKVIKDNQLAPHEAESLRDLAKNVSALSGEEKRLASQDLQVILKNLDKPSMLKKISSLQTQAQLLNPKTQVRNALGNELFYRIERLNKMVATPIDIARSKITGGDRTVTFKTNNQGQYWENFMRGLKAGWKGANVNGLETQYDLASPAFKSKYNPLTYTEKALGAALKSFDTAAYMRAYNNTLGEQATLRAINEGQAGNKQLIQKYIRESDENLMNIANEYGKYATFQDNNVISKGMTALKKGLNAGKEFGIGDLVLKYPKTPGALLMRALEYSPAGFVRSAAIAARPWLKKEVNTAEATQALSRAIIGTFGLSGLGYFLLDKGVLTGQASKDKDVRDLQRSAGQGQYQVNLSALARLAKSGFNPEAAKLKEGDNLYTYDWMQPVSMAISMGANIDSNMKEGKQKFSGLPGTIYNSAEGSLGTLTEQSVLSGIKSAAQGSPGQTVTDKIIDIVSGIPSSFVPTGVNQIRQLMDNKKRETYSTDKLQASLNPAIAKIPGLADKLPQQFDTLGNPKQTQQKNSAFNVLFNPGNSSKYELSPEAKLIVDLINESGDEAVAPRVPGKTITVDGQSVKLNGDQFSRLQQLQGEETKRLLDKKNVTSGSLKNRLERVGSINTDAGSNARRQLVKEFPELKPPKKATR